MLSPTRVGFHTSTRLLSGLVIRTAGTGPVRSSSLGETDSIFHPAQPVVPTASHPALTSRPTPPPPTANPIPSPPPPTRGSRPRATPPSPAAPPGPSAWPSPWLDDTGAGETA